MMETKNKRLLDLEENKKYYAKSDGNYMDPKMCTKAHLVLDRIAWARKWVHELGSKYHIDFGCKDGYFGLTLASEGVNYIGVDPSKDAIDEAQLRAAELELDVNFVVDYLESFEIKVANLRFDTVSMMEVLEHVIDPVEAIKKLCSLGNFVMITTPDAEGRHGMEDSKQNEEHVRLYTEQELRELVEPFGEIMELVKRDEQLCILFQSK